MAYSGDQGGGLEALHRLKSTDPPLFLSSNPDLSLASRVASQYLFASLKPYTPKSPFDQLLTDGFDAEQIWQQIDLQSQPLISSLRRDIKRFEKDPGRISRVLDKVQDNGAVESEIGEDGDVGLERESEGLDDDVDLELSDDEGEERENEEESESEDGDGGEEEEREEEEEEEDDDDDDDDNKGTLVDDKFLKIKELEKYLEEDEEREYGLWTKKKEAVNEEDSEDADVSDNDEDEDDYKLGLYEEDDGDDELANARYEDFFGSKKKQSKKSEQVGASDGFDTEDEDRDNVSKQNLSKHEKEQEKIRAKIAEMEKANLEENNWTMQGEVTAAKRPKDSALVADLDFELNVRPPPVITEEVTASIEEIIKKRIIEGQFDDVEKVHTLPSRAPTEVKELDEKKSKKGLAELYEEDYLQKTGLASATLSFSDELKKEASLLFKRLCLKLDALSHFHFAPKPVVEDMSVEANLPALAMEEVAPVAVSDAAMLAPEEVFAGKGDVKEEAELTQADRKRRRAKKKRKFKAEQAKRNLKKPRETSLLNQSYGKNQSRS